MNQIKSDCDCVAYPQESGVLMRKLRRRLLLWMCSGWCSTEESVDENG